MFWHRSSTGHSQQRLYSAARWHEHGTYNSSSRRITTLATFYLRYLNDNIPDLSTSKSLRVRRTCLAKRQTTRPVSARTSVTLRLQPCQPLTTSRMLFGCTITVPCRLIKVHKMSREQVIYFVSQMLGQSTSVTSVPGCPSPDTPLLQVW